MKVKEERGAIILESVYCIFVTLVVTFAIMSYGFFLYQNTLVTIVANEVAEEAALTYKFKNVTDASEIKKSDIGNVGMYRYLFSNSLSFRIKNQSKAKQIAEERLEKTSLAKEEGPLDVKLKIITDDIGRRHYEVTVRQKYTFMLGELLKIAGLGDSLKIERTAYAECLDASSYMNTIRIGKYAVGKAEDEVKILKTIDKAIDLLYTIMD
uniref:hypothetical protein n=1 Tax=Agathobacter sp. TaxID=2021311 RepID=UPI0040569757